MYRRCSCTVTTIRSFLLMTPQRSRPKIVKGSVLKVYEGAPHGMCTTLADRVNADLLAFARA